MTTLDLPEMYLPFPSRCHPEVRETEQAGLDWLSRFDPGEEKYQLTVVTKYGHCVARCLPYASRAMLDVCTRLMVWQLWFDDTYADTVAPDSPDLAPAVTSIVDMLLDGPGTGAAGKAMEAAFRELLGQFREVLTPTQYQQFAMENRTWLLGLVLQNSLRDTGKALSVGTYMTSRLQGVGAQPWSVLGAAAGAGRHELSMQEYFSPHIRAMLKTSANVVAWQNDVFSYFKEKDHPVVFWNLPAVLEAQGMSTTAALAKATELTNQEVEKFLRIKAEVAHRLSPAEQDFVIAGEDLMRGCYDWSTEIARYTGWRLTPAPLPPRSSVSA